MSYPHTKSDLQDQKGKDLERVGGKTYEGRDWESANTRDGPRKSWEKPESGAVTRAIIRSPGRVGLQAH